MANLNVNFRILLEIVATAFVVSGIAIFIYANIPAKTIIVSSTIYKHSYYGNASIALTLNATSYIVSRLDTNLTGNNISISIPVSIVSRCLSYGHIGPLPVVNGSLPHISNQSFLPCEKSTSVIFTGLKPYANYIVSIEGYESPYCPPGTLCPMFILHVQKSIEVETAANGSITNVSFTV